MHARVYSIVCLSRALGHAIFVREHVCLSLSIIC